MQITYEVAGNRVYVPGYAEAGGRRFDFRVPLQPGAAFAGTSYADLLGKGPGRHDLQIKDPSLLKVRVEMPEEEFVPRMKHITNIHDHHRPFPGDHGILFERAVKSAKATGLDSKARDGGHLGWLKPNLDSDKNHGEIIRAAKELSKDGIDVTPEDVRKALQAGGLVTLTESLWHRLENTTSTEKLVRIRDVIRYANKHGKRVKVTHALEEFIFDRVHAPIVLKFGPKRYWLVNGNTRLMICRLYRIEPQVWMGELGTSAKSFGVKALATPGAYVLNVPDVRQTSDFSCICGAASFASAARYFSVKPDTEAEAIRALGTTEKDGTAADRIVAAARAAGLQATPAAGMTVQALRAHVSEDRPVICAVQPGHWVVVCGYDGDGLYVQDPSYGPRRMMDGEFEAGWWDEDADGKRLERWGVALEPGPENDKEFWPQRRRHNDCHEPDTGRFCSTEGGEGGGESGGTALEAARSYQPVKSIAEAEKYAADKLGVEAKFDGATLDDVNYALEGLTGLRERDGLRYNLPPDLLVGKAPTNLNAILQYGRGQMRVYSGAKEKADALVKTGKELEAKGQKYSWLSTTDPHHFVVHEYGHYRHESRGDDKDPGGVKEAKVKEHAADISQEVSRYAATEYKEFAAETYAGLALGKKYSPKIMGLFKDVGGVYP